MEVQPNVALLAYDYPFLGVFWSMLVFFAWVIWFVLLFRIIIDIFSRHDIGGGSKVLWIIFVIILPFLGVFVYLIARGRGRTERDVKQAQAQDAAFRSYVQDAATSSGGGAASELSQLADLRDRGVITVAEFAPQKAKLLAS